MHAIKGGWVGQTFALANCNDSGGKKTRIRRSKEERKAMVESFIKKHQKLNNGNFPSLNLTHKEVGGSFYTVREIVRDIIQENRVLGPSRLALEEQSSGGFLEQYPQGSISIEPETGLSSSNESHIVAHYLPGHHPGTSEELVLDSSMQCPEPEDHRINERQIINGSNHAVEKNEEFDKVINTNLQAVEGNEEFDKVIDTELQAVELSEFSRAVEKNEKFDIVINTELQAVERRGEFDEVIDSELQAVEETQEIAQAIHRDSLTKESVDLDKDVVKLEACEKKVTPITADVVVETFPLISRSKSNYGLDEISIETSELTRTFLQERTEKVEMEGGNGSSVVEISSALGNEKAEANPAGPLSGILVDDKPVADLGSSEESSTGCTTKQGISLDGNDGIISKVKDAFPGVIKPVDAVDGIHALNKNGKSNITSHDAVATKNKPNIEGTVNSRKGSKATLDRINLESWEDTLEKSPKAETNPLLAFFKSFITGFLKFWSE
ncbi:hypothetical protein NMG60_11018711 [Bertholletia excelsa]